jgi:hypothetical protein
MSARARGRVREEGARARVHVRAGARVRMCAHTGGRAHIRSYLWFTSGVKQARPDLHGMRGGLHTPPHLHRTDRTASAPELLTAVGSVIRPSPSKQAAHSAAVSGTALSRFELHVRW